MGNLHQLVTRLRVARFTAHLRYSDAKTVAINVNPFLLALAISTLLGTSISPTYHSFQANTYLARVARLVLYQARACDGLWNGSLTS